MQKTLKRAVLIAGLVLAGCGGSNPVAPPTPAPTPTPTPARPTATPGPTGLTCTVPPIPDADGCNIWSKAKGNVFLPQLLDSIDTLKKEKPELFAYSGKGGKIVTITNPNLFLKNLVKILERDHGLCAAHHVRGLPNDEISIKSSNDFNEQYDLITGSSQLWWNYTVSCRPPVF